MRRPERDCIVNLLLTDFWGEYKKSSVINKLILLYYQNLSLDLQQLNMSSKDNSRSQSRSKHPKRQLQSQSEPQPELSQEQQEPSRQYPLNKPFEQQFRQPPYHQQQPPSTSKYMTRQSLNLRPRLNFKIQQTLNEPRGFKPIPQAPAKKPTTSKPKPKPQPERQPSPEYIEYYSSNQSYSSLPNPPISQHNKNSSPGDLKLPIKKTKRRKILVKDPEDFLPQFLVFVADYHYKHTIRQGWRYQAEIPDRLWDYNKKNNLVPVRMGSKTTFDNDVFRDFKNKFGANRTEEELCGIQAQLRCAWKEVPRFLEANRDVYRKVFKEKDKILTKNIKGTN